MLRSQKKAKTDEYAAAIWQSLFDNLMPNMITINNSAPYDAINPILQSVELCYYNESEADQMASEVANLLDKFSCEIKPKTMPDGSSCDCIQLNNQELLEFFGVAFSSLLVRIHRLMHVAGVLQPDDKNLNAFISDVSALDDIASNLLARLQHSPGGMHPVILLAKNNRDAAYDFVDKLTVETCEHIALQNAFDGMYFHQFHMQIAEENIRQHYLNKISSVVYSVIAHDDDNIRMMTSISVTKLKAILASLGPDIAEIFMLAKDRSGVFFNFKDDFGFPILSSLAEVLFFDRDGGSMKDRNLRYLNECLSGRMPASYLATLGLSEIEFARMGNSIDNWWRLTSNVLQLVVQPHRRKSLLDTLPGKLRDAAITARLTVAMATNGAVLNRVLGRTLLFEKNTQDIRAVKVKKRDEELASLFQEKCVTEALLVQKFKHDLKSRFPTPCGVVMLQDVIPWAESKVDPQTQFLSRIDAATEHPAYVYEVKKRDAGYFTYLHDPKISAEVFKSANYIIVNDLFKLLQLGQVFNQLADLFHDSDKKDRRPDAGRYIVLAQLLSHTRNNYGTGMLESWMEAIEFPNLRATGLADLGDCISINDYIQIAPKLRPSFAKAFEEFGVRTGNYLMANIMAEYQYVLFLIAGRRAVYLEREAELRGDSEQQKFHIWYQAASQIMSNCAQAVSMNTFLSKQEAQQRLASIVSVNRLARQMQFWMTKRYIAFMQQGHIPKNIYGPDVVVTVDTKKFKAGNLDGVLGFTSNGKTSDLGDYNGQEPIKEANKLFYWMVNIIFVEYLNLNNMLKDVKTISRAKRTPEVLSSKIKLTQGQSANEKHALLFSMWNVVKKAKQKEERQKFDEEHPAEKITNAAITLQRIWRGRAKRAKQDRQSGDIDSVIKPMKFI